MILSKCIHLPEQAITSLWINKISVYMEHIFLHLSAAGHGGWFHDSAAVTSAEVDMVVQIPVVLTGRHRSHVAGPHSGSSLRSLQSLHADSQSVLTQCLNWEMPG